MIDTLKQFRAKTNIAIEEFAALQKTAQINKDFSLAGFYGDCKKENLKHLSKLNFWIKREE
jgi:hypothetical protein